MRSRILQAGLQAGLCAALLAAPLPAQEFSVALLSEAPPEETAAAVRAVLPDEAVRVGSADGPLMDLWFRQRVPVKSGSGFSSGVAYPQLAEGDLLGLMRLHRPHADYRNQRIAPGVYTLRVGLHPVDGSHMGVALNRDFLLLTRAEDDPTPAQISPNELIERSRRASGMGHPSVWSLAEEEDEPDSLPGLVHWEDEQFWMLYVELHASGEVEGNGRLLIVLVVAGHAPEA